MNALDIIMGMTVPQIANLFCLVFLCFGLLRGKHTLGMVAMTTCVLLVLTQVLTIEEAFAGFASDTVVMLACMYVLSAAFSRTPLMARIRNMMTSLQGKHGILLVAGVFGTCFILAQFLPSGVNVPLMVAFLSSLGDTGGEVTPSRLIFPCMGIASFCLGSLPIGLGAGTFAQVNAFYEGLVTDPDQLCTVFDPALFLLIPTIICLAFCVFGYKLLPRGGVVAGQNSGRSAIQTGGEMIVGRGEKIVYFCFFGAVLGLVVGELILTLIGRTASPYYAIFIFGLATIIMTTFMSNFGSLAVLSPLAASTAIAAGWNPLPFMLMVRSLAWCDIALPSASSAAATGHAAAGYKLGESMPFSLIYLALALGGCMISTLVFFPF